MTTLNAYVLRLTMKPLLVALLIALLLLLVERMLRLLDLVLGSKGSLDVLVKLLTFLVPHYMGLAIPAAFFLALVITFSGLQRDSELDALRSAGIGLHQQLKPVIALALILTALTAVLYGYLQPHARYTYRSLVHGLTNRPLNNYLQDGLFIKVEGTTYMAEGIDRDRRRFSRIFAYQEGDEGVSATMTAQNGQLVEGRDGGPATLILMDGRRMDIEPDPLGAAEGEERMPNVLDFDETRMTIDLSREKDFRGRGADERELTVTELWRQRDQPPNGVSTGDMLGEFHDRLVRIVSVLVLPFLALPLAIGSRRAQRSSGIGLGLVILIVYNKVLSAGENMTAYNGISPLIAQWLPFALFAAFSLALFLRAAFTVSQGSRVDEFLARVAAAMRAFRERRRQNRGEA